MEIRLDHFDREIIRVLGNIGQSNTNEIADNLKISWVTALLHLKKLKSMRYVSSHKEKTILFWKLKYSVQ